MYSTNRDRCRSARFTVKKRCRHQPARAGIALHSSGFTTQCWGSCLTPTYLATLLNQVFLTKIQIETEPLFVMDVIRVGNVVGEKTLLETSQ